MAASALSRQSRAWPALALAAAALCAPLVARADDKVWQSLTAGERAAQRAAPAPARPAPAAPARPGPVRSGAGVTVALAAGAATLALALAGWAAARRARQTAAAKPAVPAVEAEPASVRDFESVWRKHLRRRRARRGAGI